MFVLAHLTDPHIGPLPRPRLRQLAGKRVLGWLNWRRGRHQVHRLETLAALLADLATQSTDHVVVTGDLVNIALPEEFAATGAWLRALGAPHDVTVVPGNHDAYVHAALRQWQAHWGPYLAGDATSAPTPGTPILSTFPFVRRRGPVGLVGLSSAVPTGAFMATGLLGADQIDAAEAMLGDLAAERRFRVVAIHHPPSTSPPHLHKRLLDAPALRAMLRRAGADLVLHGHDHVHALTAIEGPRGPIPVIGLPSASASPQMARVPAAYNLYRVSEGSDGFACEVVTRGYAPGAAEIQERARYLLSARLLDQRTVTPQTAK